jgi:hypothetical protein
MTEMVGAGRTGAHLGLLCDLAREWGVPAPTDQLCEMAGSDDVCLPTQACARHL